MKMLRLCLLYELKKLLTAQHGAWLIAAAILAEILLCCTAQFHTYAYPFDTDAYRIYAGRFAGAYSDEIADAIDAELSEQIAAANAPMPENLTADAYREYRAEVTLAQSKTQVLQAISEHYRTLRGTRGEMCSDLEICELAGRFSVNWCSLLCIAVLTVLVMLGDRSCGMEQLLYPTRAGRRCVRTAKLLTVGILSAGLTGICLAMQWGIFCLRFPLCPMQIPVQSLTGFSACTLHITVGQALLLSGVLQMLGALAAGAVAVLCADELHREIPAIAAAAMLIGIGAVLSGEFPHSTQFLLWKPLSGLNGLSDATAGSIRISMICMLLRIIGIGWYVRCKAS